MTQSPGHRAAESAQTPEAAASTDDAARNREAIELWVKELSYHLEIAETEIDIDAILKLAGVAAHTVVRPAAPVTTFLTGYVTGLAEASGQADFGAALRAASSVAHQLLERRNNAVG